jgi:hypothetical protein
VLLDSVLHLLHAGHGQGHLSPGFSPLSKVNFPPRSSVYSTPGQTLQSTNYVPDVHVDSIQDTQIVQKRSQQKNAGTKMQKKKNIKIIPLQTKKGVIISKSQSVLRIPKTTHIHRPREGPSQTVLRRILHLEFPRLGIVVRYPNGRKPVNPHIHPNSQSDPGLKMKEGKMVTIGLCSR